jgi:ATP-dependent DNA helicase RecQ
VHRCLGALRDARSTSDRLALLRSLVRLKGGRLDLVKAGLELSEAEQQALPRFGLAMMANSALRIADEVGPSDLPRHFAEACRLDPTPRRTSDRVAADAVILRHTRHRGYSGRTQKAAVRALVTMPPGSTLMVTMPTGSGKSLLFQLEALRLRQDCPGACLVVITPTVSLALDHLRTLAAIPGLEGSRAITGDLARDQRDEAIAAFRRGEVPILLLSPEFALSGARDAILEAARPTCDKPAGLNAQLKALFIDEAHIVESWGRAFRPDFQRLSGLLDEVREVAPATRAILLSATLPLSAKRVLRTSYERGAGWLEIDARTARYEFDLVIQSYHDPGDRLLALEVAIDRAPRPLVVYTTLAGSDTASQVDGTQHRLSATQLCAHLKARGYERIALFTGNVTDPSIRRRVLADWASDRLDIVVATSAFGMGVDKSNVRSVIHACLPESPARWYQEIGRASRDGHQGLAVCLFTDSGSGPNKDDIADAVSQAARSWLTRPKAVDRWAALRASASDVRWVGAQQAMTLDLDAVRAGLQTQRSSDYNRNWNRALLTLMQRSGVLKVASVSEERQDGRALWTVEINDPALLDLSEEAVWDQIFVVRQAEQREATEEVDTFRHLMSPPHQACIIQGVFGLISGHDRGSVPSCGRCPACREEHQDPPRVWHSDGLETVWDTPAALRPSPLAPGPMLVAPNDPAYEAGLHRLITRLASAGVEQFVVPDDLASDVARAVADTSARYGLVLGQDELETAAAELARLPTGVLLPTVDADAARLMTRCRTWADVMADQPLVIVGRPERVLVGRRLDQTASLLAPYSEDLIENLVAQSREIA